MSNIFTKLALVTWCVPFTIIPFTLFIPHSIYVFKHLIPWVKLQCFYSVVNFYQRVNLQVYLLMFCLYIILKQIEFRFIRKLEMIRLEITMKSKISTQGHFIQFTNHANAEEVCNKTSSKLGMMPFCLFLKWKKSQLSFVRYK